MTKRYERELTLEELANVRDEEIDLSDIPDFGDEFWNEAKAVYPGERLPDTKKIEPPRSTSTPH